ncbi:MAG: DinB family protein [Gemmatimonadaceae bacterium]
MKAEQVLTKLDSAWRDFKDSYAGLSDAQLLMGGVTGEWSVRDIIAHVTWWEEEALEHLPLIRTGGRPPRYSVKYGGINAFNALKTEERRGLSLSEVRRQQEEVHKQLVEYISLSPADLFARETRFRRRLRLDTYGHYPVHTRAIRKWRSALVALALFTAVARSEAQAASIASPQQSTIGARGLLPQDEVHGGVPRVVNSGIQEK